MNELFERYDVLASDVIYQIEYITDYYTFDFDHLKQQLNEMQKIQTELNNSKNFNE